MHRQIRGKLLIYKAGVHNGLAEGGRHQSIDIGPTDRGYPGLMVVRSAGPVLGYSGRKGKATGPREDWLACMGVCTCRSPEQGGMQGTRRLLGIGAINRIGGCAAPCFCKLRTHGPLQATWVRSETDADDISAVADPQFW